MSSQGSAEQVTAEFTAEEYERLTRAARVTGRSITQYVRDAVVAATHDPFVKALERAAARAAELVAAAPPPAPGNRPDPEVALEGIDAPMGSRDLDALRPHHAA